MVDRRRRVDACADAGLLPGGAGACHGVSSSCTRYCETPHLNPRPCPTSHLWLCSTAGLPQVAYPRNQHDVAARANFKQLSEMLESGPFRFRKPLLRDVCDVFRQSSGIFLIHCEVVHAEDFELEDRLTESVPHYIVYNAGTRVLFLYPEVLVILDEDIQDVPAFLARIREPPYLVRVASGDGTARQWVRQIWYKPAQ